MKHALGILLAIVCGSASADIVFFGTTGQSRYARFDNANNTAVDLTEGTGLKLTRYVASDAAIDAATPDLPSGNYSYTIRSGTAAGQASGDAILGTGYLEWTGTQERVISVNDDGSLACDLQSILGTALSPFEDIEIADEFSSFFNGDNGAGNPTTHDIWDAIKPGGVGVPIGANGITAASIASDAIGASEIAADAIGSSEIAASAAQEIGAEANPSSGQVRVNKPPAPGYTLRASRRSDGTYRFDKPVRIRPGAVGNITVGLDLSPVYGAIIVETVDDPTVSGGSITAAAAGPRDSLAMVTLAGTATASETRTVDVPVTMDTGETETWTFEVKVFAD